MKQKKRAPSKVLGVSVLIAIFGTAILLAALTASVSQAGASDGAGNISSFASVATFSCLESDSGALDIEGMRVKEGKEVRVPIRIQPALNQILAFGFEVTYPAQVMEFSGFEPGDLADTSSPSLEVTSVAPGRLSVSLAGSQRAIPKGASGSLVWLNFQTQEDSQEQSKANVSVSENENVPRSAGLEVGIANPASVYCINNGGSLEIREDAEGNQYGVCLFSDGSECEEWAYFRGECTLASKDQCYPLQIENLTGDLALFSVSEGCLCLYICPEEGDLNGDGITTPDDALIAFRCYLKSGPCSDCADVNEDGIVTPGDALCIFKYYLGQSSCLDHQPQAAPAPAKMEGEWQSQNLPGGGKLTIDRDKKIVEMLGSPLGLGQGSLTHFHYTPTGGSSPISFQAKFAAGSYTAFFTGTASNSLCPPGVWCIWAGRFTVDGEYSIKDNLGQLLDEGTFNLKYPMYP